MDNIQVGDYVRSFDFPDMRSDCYVEGTVVAIGRHAEFSNDCDRYTIMVQKAVIEGKVREDVSAGIVYPPVNGTPTWLGKKCHGVVKLPKPTQPTQPTKE